MALSDTEYEIFFFLNLESQKNSGLALEQRHLDKTGNRQRLGSALLENLMIDGFRAQSLQWEAHLMKREKSLPWSREKVLSRRPYMTVRERTPSPLQSGCGNGPVPTPWQLQNLLLAPRRQEVSLVRSQAREVPGASGLSGACDYFPCYSSLLLFPNF